MRRYRSTGKKQFTRPTRRRNAVSPGLNHLRTLRYEMLEDRRLLSITLQGVNGVIAQYDAGATAFDSAQGLASTIASQALGSANIAPFSGDLGSILGIAKDLQTPFQNIPNTNDAWADFQTELTNAHFTIPTPYPGDNAALNAAPGTNLLLVSWSQTYSNVQAALTSNGKTSIPYLDGGTGLLGGITGSVQSITIELTCGIDVGQNGLPEFFVADTDSGVTGADGLTYTSGIQITNFSATGALSGSLAIGSMLSVNATVQASIQNVNANVSLHSGSYSGKIFLGDFLQPGVATADVYGSIDLSGEFGVNLLSLTNIDWTGDFPGTIDDGGVTWGDFTLTPPSADSILSSIGPDLFSLAQKIPILGPLAGELNRPIPYINTSIAQITGLSHSLPTVPSASNAPGFTAQTQDSLDASSLSPDSSGLNNLGFDYSIPLGPGTLSVDVTPQTLMELIRGQAVDLVQWTTGYQTVSLVNFQESIPILGIGIPDIASAEIDASFGINASLSYDFGFGIDTNGLYFDAYNPGDKSTHPLVDLSFALNAGLEGKVEVLGFPLASAGGSLGFTVSPYVALTAPPGSTTPDKVYLSDLEEFGSNPLADFVDALSAGVKGDLTGQVNAGINLLFLKLGWSWGINIPVFNYEHNPAWPAAGGAGTVAIDPYPAGPVNGVLTFTGVQGENDNVTLSGGTNGTVTLAWAGHVNPYTNQDSQTYTGVTKVVFNGSGGNDRLVTASGFDIPIYAQSNDGSTNGSFLEGGDGGNTLIAGAGNDTLIGGDGQDSLQGGAGNDLIIAHDGSDTIAAGGGATQVYVGAGNCSITGGAGNDSIYGGSGNDTIHGGSGVYFIDGGSGNQLIYGDAGHAAETIHGVLTYPIIHGGSGNDTIYGGTARQDFRRQRQRHDLRRAGQRYDLRRFRRQQPD